MSDIPSAEDLDRIAEEERARQATKRVRVAYVAGPYRSPTLRGIVENIRAAEAIALRYWLAGYAVICPHLNTFLFDGAADDDVWLRGDIEILKRCDVVIAMPKWLESAGARAEVSVAISRGIQVIYEKE